ncbi:MAG TPA: hypothetical protein VLG44_02265 [Chlamydiales bacterium]|nr:hypothetical protein [Chlamydiales bacterium]
MSLPVVNAFRVESPPDDNCPVCRESLQNGEEVFDHEGDHANRHKLHKKCMEQMLIASNGLCGFCKHPINESSLYSLKERRAISRSAFKNNALRGMIQALVLGGSIYPFLPMLTKCAAKKLLLDALMPVGTLSFISCLFAWRFGQSLNLINRDINEHAVIMGMIVGTLSGLLPRSIFINPSFAFVLGTIATVGALTSGTIAYTRRWET